MTHTPNWYNDPHSDTYTDTPFDEAGFFEASSEADFSYDIEHNETSNSDSEWYPTEYTDEGDSADWDDDLQETASIPPAQRPIYRGIMTLVAVLVIAGLVLYWLAPFLNHLLNPLPPPPLPPPWMA